MSSELPSELPSDLPSNVPETIPSGIPDDKPSNLSVDKPKMGSPIENDGDVISGEGRFEDGLLRRNAQKKSLKVTDLNVGDKLFGRTLTKISDTDLDYKKLLSLDENERFERASSQIDLSYEADGEHMWLGAGNDVVNSFNHGEFLNMTLLNKYFIEYVNADRRLQGIAPLAYEPGFQKAADIRAQEMAEYGHIRYEGKAHTRPNGEKWIHVMKDIAPSYPYGLGENILAYSVLSNPYQLTSEQWVAKQLFDRWKASKSHYENMMDSRLTRTAISVKMTSREGARSDNETNWMIGEQILADGSVGDIVK